MTSDSVLPSDCGCGGKKTAQEPQKVYALGRLGFDYGTRQKREYFRNQFLRNGLGGDPDNETALYEYLVGRPVTLDAANNPIRAFDTEGRPILDGNGVPLYHQLPYYKILNGPQFRNRADVTSLIWILRIDETPVYALAPAGAFAFETHDTLTAFLKDQFAPPPVDNQGDPNPDPDVYYGESVERMAVPGVIVGMTRLYTGEQVPVIVPDHRGLANWTTQALIDAVDQIVAAPAAVRSAVRRILDRLYELTRNLGTAPRERALNYAATDAVLLQGILADPVVQAEFAGLELDSIEVVKSPICRPDYDCWDVVILFYNPANLQEARRGIRYTVDVSDVMPNIIANSQRVFTLR